MGKTATFIEAEPSEAHAATLHIRQLEQTIFALREELERVQVDKQQAVQEAVSNSVD